MSLLHPTGHLPCSRSSQSCQVECVANLTLYLNKYMDELSRVIFRSYKECWLAIFYSFCLQSVVRRALIILANGQREKPGWINEYLHIAIRLFIAVSGTYDPLIQPMEENTAKKHRFLAKDSPTTSEDCEAARVVIGLPDDNFHSSGDYLKKIFDDTGAPISYNAEPLWSEVYDKHLQRPAQNDNPYPIESNYSTSEVDSNSTNSISSTASFGLRRGTNLMSRFEITKPHVDKFQCTYPGCTAPPFLTQVSCIYYPCDKISSLQYSSIFLTAIQMYIRSVGLSTAR